LWVGWSFDGFSTEGSFLANATGLIQVKHPSPPSFRISRSQSHFLDLARWFAAFLVVIEHVRNMLLTDYVTLENAGLLIKGFYFLTGFGHEAVVVFFVISGFLVGGKVVSDMRARRFSWRKYLADRISRLYAVLIVALTLGAILDFAGVTFIDSSGIYGGQLAVETASLSDELPERLSSTVYVGNLLMMQNIQVPTFGSNGPLWSLAHEWWYYLLFPLLILVFRGNTRTKLISLISLMVVASLVSRFILILFGIWLLGVVASMINGRSLVPWYIGVLLTVAGGIVMRLETIIPGLAAQFLLGASFALLLNGLAGRETKLPFAKKSKAFADFSYSVYLVHFPVALFCIAAVMHWNSWDQRLVPSVFAMSLFAAIVGITLAVSYLVSLVTENRTYDIRALLYKLAHVK
jgi:peptidoglycan/LPS O-acetylase OafA/YrhL